MSATRLMMLGCPDVLAARIDAQITAQASDADELVASGLHPVTASEVARCINSLTNDPRPLIALGVQPHLANEIVKLTAEGAGLVFDNDFTQGYLDPRITFSRPGDSGRVVDGTYRVWGPDEPVLTPDGWSLRPAETNYGLYSRTMGQWSVATGGSRLVSSMMLGPDPGYTMMRLEQDATTGLHRINTNTPAEVRTPGNKHTVTFFAKRGEVRYLFANFSAALGLRAVIDLETGDYIDSPGTTVTVTPLLRGIYLVNMTGVLPSTPTPTVFLQMQQTFALADQGYPGVDGEGLYVSDVQFNQGDPIPYIPTTTGAVTRPADDVDILGSDFAGIWNPTGWAVILDVGQLVNTPLGYLFSVSDGTVSNFAGIQINSSGALDFQNTGTGGGGVLGAPASWPYAGKIGLTQSGGRIRCHVDGTTKLDIAATVPAAISRFSLGKVASQNRLPITSKRLAIFNQGLSEARMNELTS